MFAFGLGVCAGAAVVFKPNAGLYFPALLLWVFFYRRAPSPISRAGVIGTLVPAVLGAALVPIIALVWLWRLDLLHEARVSVIDFNRFYVSQGFSVRGYAMDFSKAVWLRIKTDPLWLGGAAATLVAMWNLARRRRLPPVAGLAILWGGAGALVIVINGARLFNSYFIQVFAPLALFSAWLLTEAARQSMIRRVIAVTTAALMLVVLLVRHYPEKILTSARADAAVLRGHIDRDQYLDQFGGFGNRRGYSARANADLADYVRDHTSPDDRIFLFGINGAGVYFAADRLPAHRFLRANFFVATDFPDPSFRLSAVTADLAARHPRYLIFERLNSGSEMGRAVDSLPEDPGVAGLLADYRRETQIEDFTLYRRIP